ncbi:hypothetical protein FHG87_015353 [Trinorchestia longiramus]|nr:hypothetical protein FHG87_015353 [Trinorchestia longiramus]
MAAQAVTMAQPWVLDAYHDLVAASLVTPAVGAHPSLPSPHMPRQQPLPSHAATAAVPPPPSMPHPHHHLMGTPLTSTISIASPIASPLSPALPIGSPMIPLGTTDPLTSIPAWGNWDTLVATTASGLPPTTVQCHPEGFYYLDPAWFG